MNHYRLAAIAAALAALQGCASTPKETPPVSTSDEIMISYAKSAANAVQAMAAAREAAIPGKAPTAIPVPVKREGLNADFGKAWIGSLSDFVTAAATASGWKSSDATGYKGRDIVVAIPEGRTVGEAILDASAQAGTMATLAVDRQQKRITACFGAGCAEKPL